MKMGVGFSKEKSPDAALQEAYRKSLQRLGATKSDLSFVFYSYDYGVDPAVLTGAFKRVFKYTPNIGASTWGAWSEKEAFEGETGLIVMSLKEPSFEFDLLKVNSLREKAELWSAELARQIGDKEHGTDATSLLLLSDSLNFTPGTGFSFLERHFPKMQAYGFGTSFSIPQCSVVLDGDVYVNALTGLLMRGAQPWLGILQGVKPELQQVAVNRMSENLIIELDGKPAFYKLCEHLMVQDDLPMMSPDEFRKHMGNLFMVEMGDSKTERPQTFGDSYRVVSLLGSEMTTGMVAVANPLDFSQIHYLGQKKSAYAEAEGHAVLKQLKEKIPKPSMVWMFCSHSRNRDKDRQTSDFSLVQSYFPETPVLGVSSNGEYLGGVNQYAALIAVFP